MPRLTQNEFELLLDCIRELHTHRSLTGLRAWLLDQILPKLIPSDWISYNEVDLRNPENTLSILKPEANVIFEQLFPRFKEVLHQHPLITRQMQLADFPVHKISDFLTQQAYHELELYRDVYQPMGVEYQIAATVRLDPDHVTAFALSRQRDDYTERDRTILEMLRPHLVVAFNNLALSNAQQALLDGHELALRELASATIIVNLQNRILYHTGAGLQWIGATSPGVLPAAVSDWLHQPAANGTPANLRFISPEGEILIRAVPTHNREQRLLVLTKNVAPTSAPSVRSLGLSPRELEVGHWIGEGKTNAEIARILNISPRTVQKHVEHMFEKLGVSTRVAIVTRLLG